MSQTMTPDRLLEERGVVRTLGAFVVGAAYDRSGSYDAVWGASILLALMAALVHLPIPDRPVARLGAPS